MYLIACGFYLILFYKRKLLVMQLVTEFHVLKTRSACSEARGDLHETTPLVA
jgi:hypothetical protein